ncbi:MAG: DUF1638 domain-containing protein [Methanomassiliicoccales archaeon]|nr:DUF1638 domain-containing protein [Methanomassiliicoccales archaeon]
MGSRGDALGIIACHMLEDELVHVLSGDENVTRLLIVDSGVSKTLMPKLRSHCAGKALETVQEEKLSEMEVRGEGNILIWQRPINLHIAPEELKDEGLRCINAVKDLCSSILMFYGLCGNAFRNLEALTQGIDVPVTILKDASGQVVDDCMGAAAGGVEAYLKLLRTHHGAFFLSPMWASDWRRFFVDIMVLHDPNDLEGARYIFQYMNYTTVTMMCTGLGGNDEFHKDVGEFSKAFNLKMEEFPCNTSVVDSSYARAKGRMHRHQEL